MPILHLENVPEELFQRIEALAAAERVPVTDQAIHLLREAVTGKPITSARSQQEVLDDILRHRFRPLPGAPTILDMLREDRGR